LVENSKFQAPSTKQIRNFKTQIPNCFEFVLLNFGFVWNLEFGAWCLVLMISSDRQPPTADRKAFIPQNPAFMKPAPAYLKRLTFRLCVMVYL